MKRLGNEKIMVRHVWKLRLLPSNYND